MKDAPCIAPQACGEKRTPDPTAPPCPAEAPAARPETEALAQALADRAQALFDSREMYCAEAVLCALSEGLGGGLDREQARALAMGFGQGLGEAGCVCGALGGAVIGASWFLSRQLTPGQVRGASNRLHARFKAAHGSSCCRVLVRKVKDQPREHFRQCSGLTRHGALLAAREILEHAPLLEQGADRAALARRRSRLGSWLRRLADRLG